MTPSRASALPVVRREGGDLLRHRAPRDGAEALDQREGEAARRARGGALAQREERRRAARAGGARARRRAGAAPAPAAAGRGGRSPARPPAARARSRRPRGAPPRRPATGAPPRARERSPTSSSRSSVSTRSRTRPRSARFAAASSPRELSRHLAVGPEAEALEDAGPQALHQHLAVAAHARHELGRLVARDHGARPIHELLGQPLVERVGEPVLDGARALLPEPRVRDPRRAVGDVGPGPDRRDAAEQRLDVAVRAVEVLHVRGEEVLGDAAARAAQEAEDPGEEARVAPR